MNWLLLALGLFLAAVARWLMAAGDAHHEKAGKFHGSIVGDLEAEAATACHQRAEWILAAAIGAAVLSILLTVCT